MDVDQVWPRVYAIPKGHATFCDGQMVTGGSMNRVGIGWPGQGVERERRATAHGWYHVQIDSA